MVGTAVKNRVYKRRFLGQMVSDLSAIFMSSWLHARLVFISLPFIQIQEV